MNKRIENLKRERAKVASSLFLFRCVIAWIPIVAFQLFGQKPFTIKAMLLFVIGIPLGLFVYDKLTARRK